VRRYRLQGKRGRRDRMKNQITLWGTHKQQRTLHMWRTLHMLTPALAGGLC
jgi:hypothetical protein